MKNKKKLAIIVAAPLLGASVSAIAMPIHSINAAQVSTQNTANAPIDLTVSNHSGKSGQMYVYMIGTVGKDSQIQGYVDANGDFHAWNQANSPTAIPATDASIVGPSNGNSIKMKIPYWFSGRIYYSFGSKMNFKVVQRIDGITGTVQPVPWDANDPSKYEDWDFNELTYSDGGLYFNSTQVDMVSNPSVIAGSGKNSDSTGGISPNGFTNLVNSITKIKGFENSVQYDKAGNPLRVLAPAHAIVSDSTNKNYLDPYINRVWDYYKNNTLTVQTDPTNHPEIKYTGKVVNGVFIFTRNGDTSGYSMKLDKPSTEDVWGCAGDPKGNTLFAGKDSNAPSGREDERGTVMRSICADLHRGVLGTQPISPSTNPNTYYQVNSMNGGLFDWYSKLVHDNMPSGKAYGFAFDDVGSHESLVHIEEPKTASIDVINRGTGVISTPTTPTNSTTSPTSPTTIPTTPTSPTTSPTTPTSPTTSNSSSKSVNVSIPSTYPGYMTLNLGSGTDASALGIFVDGKQVSTVSVNGAGAVRADVPVSSGNHTIMVKSLSGKNIGTFSINGFNNNSTTPTTIPTTNTPAPTQNSNSKVIAYNFTKNSPGYGSFIFGNGTKGGLITIKVDGGSTSTIAIDGPGTYRANISAPVGSHNITVTSNNVIGDVTIK